MRRKSASTNWKARPVFWVVAALVLVVGAAMVWWFNRPGVSPLATWHRATPTASPGSNPAETPSTGAGNPGDQAKSEISQVTPTPTPAPTPTPGSTVYAIQLSDIAYTPQAGGGLRVSNIVTGASAGQCTLGLTDPSSAKRTVTGEVLWSGSYAFCSFGAVSGVSTAGTWQADLSVQNGSDKSAVSHATFEVRP